MIKIIDTYPEFQSYWERAQHWDVEKQINAWKEDYLSRWPELLKKQIADYESQDLDWRQIARERVFPNLAGSLASMELAHQHLLELSESIYLKGQQHFKFDADLKFVIYVGIGCGAGWVTSYQGAPAILFGLENIAECGWSGRPAISGLIAHELGHVIHDQTRRANLHKIGDDPWWQLYREGFAQYWEGLIMGAESWHQQLGQDPSLAGVVPGKPGLVGIGIFEKRKGRRSGSKVFWVLVCY